MHRSSFGYCQLKKHLSLLFENDLLERRTVQERLSHVPWTAESLSPRYPSQFSRMGFWKAEEFQKFPYPISEVLLGGLLPDEHCEAWEYLAGLVEFLYCQGGNGWTVDSTAIFQEIDLRYDILVEESQGLNSCRVVSDNITHIHEDVLNFSSPDNYWRYNFERAVKRYVSISSNHKNIEITFARAELRRDVLKVLSLKSQEVDSETETVCYPTETHQLAGTCGTLVGKLKPLHLSDASQMNFISVHLAACVGANQRSGR